MHRDKVIRKLLKLADTMIQTGFSQTMRTCGTPSCGCHSDPSKKHGPHSYASFKSLDGKSTGMYVPPEHVAEVRQARQAWKEFWEMARALAALNREQLKESWGAERKAKVRR